jgi:hypothetical protein
VENIISKLIRSNIGIDVVDGKLKLSLPDNFNSPEIIEEVRSNKEAIIGFLKKNGFRAKEGGLDTLGGKDEIERVLNLEKQDYYDAPHMLKKEFVRFHVVGPYSFNVNFYLLFEFLDKEVMHRTLFTIMERHESLRTSMCIVDGCVKQKIFEEVPSCFEIGYINVKDVGDEKLKNSIIYSKASDVLFDFRTQPLVSFTVVDYSENICGLYVSMHHAISDETSLEILKREITTLYETFLKGEPNPLQPIKVQHKDYSIWVSSFLQGEKGRSYRDRYLESIKESLMINGETGGKISYRDQLIKELKKITQREDVDHLFEAFGTIGNLYVAEGATYITYIRESLLAKLKKISLHCGSSLFMTVATGIAVLFNKLENKRSVRMCLPYSTRVFKEFESIIGWLTGEIVIALEVDRNKNVEELITIATEKIIETSAYRFYPFEAVLDDLDIPISILSPIYLNFISKPDIENIPTDNMHNNGGSGYYSLNIRMVEYRNCIAITCQYCTDVYTPDIIESYFDDYSKVLEAMLENPDIPLASFIDNF